MGQTKRLNQAINQNQSTRTKAAFCQNHLKESTMKVKTQLNLLARV